MRDPRASQVSLITSACRSDLQKRTRMLRTGHCTPPDQILFDRGVGDLMQNKNRYFREERFSVPIQASSDGAYASALRFMTHSNAVLNSAKTERRGRGAPR